MLLVITTIVKTTVKTSTRGNDSLSGLTAGGGAASRLSHFYKDLSRVVEPEDPTFVTCLDRWPEQEGDFSASLAKFVAG